MRKVLAIALSLVALNFASSTFVAAAVPPTNDVQTQKVRAQQLQANLESLRTDIKNVEKEISVSDSEADRAQLQAKKTALEAKVERVTQEMSAL